MSQLHIRTITEAQAKFTGILAYACTIPGTIMCFLILVAYAVAACIPVARVHLDRVSFRLLTYAMVFNLLYGIAFSVTASLTDPGKLCNFGAFAVNFTLTFSAFFTFCIALNLQLVLVHNFNGKTMEKYYIIGTTIFSLALTVVPYALNQFGFDVANSTCWFKNPDDALRLKWLIGTQSFWMLLIAAGETFCSTVVLIQMVRFEINYRKLYRGTHSTSSYSRKATGSTWSGNTPTLMQASKYRGIIFRIALYPLVSMTMNCSTVILDLYQMINGVHTELQFRLTVLDLVLYGFRTAAYASLAAFDPALTHAIRAVRDSRRKTTRLPPSSGTQGSVTIAFSPGKPAHSGVTDSGKYIQSTDSYPQYTVGGKDAPDLEHTGVHVITTTATDSTVRRTRLSIDMDDESDRNFHQQI